MIAATRPLVERAMQEVPPPTVGALAVRLGWHPATLRKHFADLVAPR